MTMRCVPVILVRADLNNTYSPSGRVALEEEERKPVEAAVAIDNK